MNTPAPAPLRHPSYTPMDGGHLSVVVNDNTTHLSQRKPATQLPDFEGNPVQRSAAKVHSVKGIDLDGAVYKVDEFVKIVIEAQVTGIHHDVDGHELVRVHRFKALSGVVVEWDLDLEDLK